MKLRSCRSNFAAAPSYGKVNNSNELKRKEVFDQKRKLNVLQTQ